MKTQTYNPVAEFANEEKVYLHLTKVQGPYTVKKSTFNRLSYVFMYEFHEITGAYGECYLKRKKNDPKRHFASCIRTPPDHIGIMSEGYSTTGGNLEMLMDGTRSPSGSLFPIFFRCDQTFLQWLKTYANGRIGIDVGAGCGWFGRSLNNVGLNTVLIEPMWSSNDVMQLNIDRMESGKNMIHAFAQPVEELRTFITTLGSKALMIFARPSHGGWVEEALEMRPKGMEALYITLPKNLEIYDDLGSFRKNAKQIKYEGFCADKEIVFSIK